MKHETCVKNAAISIGLDADTVSRLMAAYRNFTAAKSHGLAAREDVLDLVERLRQTYDFKSQPIGRATASDACRAVGIENPSRAQCMAMGEALRIVTERRPYKSNGRLVYVVPSRKGNVRYPDF